MSKKKDKNKVTRDRNIHDGYCALLIWGVPTKLKKQFKMACLRKDMTMRDSIVELLKKYVASA